MTNAAKYGYGLVVVIIAVVILIFLSSLLPLSSDDSRDGLTDEEDAGMTVTLVMRQKDNDFWRTVRMGAEAAAKEFGVKLQVAAPGDKDDVDGQIKLVQQSILHKTDALVIAAADDRRIAEAIKDVNIPVMAIDTEMKSPQVRSFIGINNYEAGQKAGEKMIELLGKQGHVFILSSLKEDRNTEEREHGLIDAFKKAKFITVLSTRYCMSGTNYCQKVTGVVMKQSIVNGIVALDSDASIGAADELEALGVTKQVQIVTFDSTYEQLEKLQDGALHATIVQNPFSMGYLGVKHAAEALDGQSIPERVDIQTKVIDLENMFWLDNQKLLFPFVK